MQLLRLLQRLRLHQLFEGLAADDDPALALPNAEFALRTNADVLKVNTDGSGKEAIGVTYVDAQGGEVEPPAAMVILAAFHLHNSSCNAKPTFGAQAPVSRRVRDPPYPRGPLYLSNNSFWLIGVQVLDGVGAGIFGPAGT